MNTFELSIYYIVQYKNEKTWDTWEDISMECDSLIDAAQVEKHTKKDTRIIKRVITNAVLSENINKYNKE